RCASGSMPRASPSPRGTDQTRSRSATRGWARGRSCSHAEVFAEIDLAHVGVGHDLVGCAFGEHGALADDVGAVADAQGLADVVVRDQHADAARLQEADDAL